MRVKQLMNKFVRSMLALGLTSALSVTSVQAATYTVVDKGEVSSFDANSPENTYGQQENNSGDMVLSGSGLYNFPIFTQYLTDTEISAIALEDVDAFKAGTPTANDLERALSFLNSAKVNYGYQKLGAAIALVHLGASSEEFVVWDQVLPNTSQLSRSTTDIVKGITDDRWLYGKGSAPYLPQTFINEGDEYFSWSREFSNRGFYSPDAGQSFLPIISPDNRYGGESAILDVNDAKVAVGFVSTDMMSDVIDNIQRLEGVNGDFLYDCKDDEFIPDPASQVTYTPINTCITKERSIPDVYQLRAFKTQLTPTGHQEIETLGLLVTPHEDDERRFISSAQAINNQGTVVGYSHGWTNSEQTSPTDKEPFSLYAVVFKDGQVTSFTDEHTTYFDSRAYDINDAGIATGYVTKFIRGDRRKKFYYIDTTDTENMSLQFTDNDFFDSSSSVARAINEAGLIVGQADVDSNERRQHAFLYDINTDTFTDVNDFLTCDSPYTIIQAYDINDNNIISATALLTQPVRDAIGELVLDDNGDALVEEVLRAVSLQPQLGGVIEDCSDGPVERQGAGLGLWGLFLLFSAGVLRLAGRRKS